MTKPFFNPCWIVDKRALWLRRGCDQSRAHGHVGSLSAVWLSEIFCSLVAKQTRRQIGWAFVITHGRSLLCLSQPPTFNLFFKVKCILVVWQRRNLTKEIRFIISDLYRQEEQESEIPMKILYSVVVELLLGTRALTDYQHTEYFII